MLVAILTRLSLCLAWICLKSCPSMVHEYIIGSDWKRYSQSFNATPILPGSLVFLGLALATAYGFLLLTTASNLSPNTLAFRKLIKVEFPVYTMAVTIALPITAVVTNIIKILVGRPRPDFVHRCFPTTFVHGNQPSMDAFENLVTQGTSSVCEKINLFTHSEIRDGLKSFPSGHTAYFACVCMIAGLYYFIKSRKFNSDIVETLLILLPLPIFVAITRVVDSRHHSGDVVAGLVLGYSIGFIAFRKYYSLNNTTSLLAENDA